MIYSQALLQKNLHFVCLFITSHIFQDTDESEKQSKTQFGSSKTDPTFTEIQDDVILLQVVKIGMPKMDQRTMSHVHEMSFCRLQFILFGFRVTRGLECRETVMLND